MQSEKITTEHKKKIAQDAIEIVEQRYILSSKNISNVIIDSLNYDYGLVSQCFREVTGLSLAKYAKRRKYTELYRKNKTEFDDYRFTDTIDGVRCLKKKVWQEFGNPVSELQNKIVIDDSDNFLFGKEMERGCKKKISRIRKSRKPIYSDGELLLIKNGEVIWQDWEISYIETEKKIYLLKGTVMESLQVINKLCTEKSVSSEQNLRISLEGVDKNGSWLYAQLVQSVWYTDVNEIVTVDLAMDFLRWEGHDLYLCLG